MIAAEWGTGQVFWSFVWFFLFFVWIWLLIMVFGDIFRSHDLSGWAKAIWTIFVIFLPYLGVFVYLIARGHKMSEHAAQAAQAQDAAMRQYVQEVAPSAIGGRRAVQAGHPQGQRRHHRRRVRATQGQGPRMIPARPA